jgi:hypothetical protein
MFGLALARRLGVSEAGQRVFLEGAVVLPLGFHQPPPLFDRIMALQDAL